MPEDQPEPEDVSDPSDDQGPDAGSAGDDGPDHIDRDPTGAMEGAGLVNRVAEVWEEVVADMGATAESYREDGWEVLEIHPGDVASPDGSQGGRWGLDVVVPGDEFEALEELVEVESFAFDESEVYRADRGGVVFLVVAVLDTDTGAAVLFPAYYDVDRGRSMLDRAMEAGEMRTHLRPLSVENVITFTYDDPSLFMPPTRDEDPEES
jgi:hypothetical protein